MSTRPYATHGGLRIRQCYNKAVIRYRDWYRTREPVGAISPTDWLLWKEWVHDRYVQMKVDRDQLIAEAEVKQKRSKRNGRNPERSDRAAASAADH